MSRHMLARGQAGELSRIRVEPVAVPTSELRASFLARETRLFLSNRQGNCRPVWDGGLI